MDAKIVEIGLFIVLITIVIYFVKKANLIFQYINKNKVIKRIIEIIMFIVIFGASIIFLRNQILGIKENISIYKYVTESKKMFNIYDEKISKENKFYKNVISQEYETQNSRLPYIPQNFEYVEGEWNTGFVIQDMNKNQYVWVPCTNKENTEIPKLQRKNFSINSLISKDECNNESYEKFLISALENGGFYISRFEIGEENNKPVSKANSKILKDMTRDEAIDIVNEMYENINCELINGYAYDTTLLWIKNNNEIYINNINCNDEKIYAGRKAYNNIYDFFDNVMEITLESSYDTVIIRGYPYIPTDKIENISLSKTGMDLENFDRRSILKNEKNFTSNTILGFRTIIYK